MPSTLESVPTSIFDDFCTDDTLQCHTAELFGLQGWGQFTYTFVAFLAFLHIALKTYRYRPLETYYATFDSVYSFNYNL